MRRRAPAVPTNFFPKDNTVPYPHSSTNQVRKSTPQGGRTTNLRQAPTPSAPTGRLVTPDKGVQAGMSVTHWCPDAAASNVFEWTCPDCGDEFFWSIVDQCWKKQTKGVPA